MDRQQYELARAIFKVDCRAKGKYVNSNGDTCAMGGLGKVLDPDATHDTLNESDILEAFGITYPQVGKIVNANDHYIEAGRDSITRRRARVIAVLDSFELEE